jgi:exopolysaccharide biosynthesis polyprenyl glycosylphosphotransferase
MLKRHQELVQVALVAADATGTAAAAILAYLAYFHSGLFTPKKGVPPVDAYLALLPAVVGACLLAYFACGLYEPRRTESFLHEVFDLGKATLAALFGVVAVSFFARQGAESRGVVALFGVLNPVALSIVRGSIRAALRAARRRGLNRRYALIVGTGKLGQRVAEKVLANPWTGLELIGFVAAGGGRRHERLRGIPVLGEADDLARIVSERGIDQVFVALPFEQSRAIRKVVDALSHETAAVTLVPDVLELVAFRSSAADFDGLPVIHLREGPLRGLQIVSKRALDIVVAVFGLVLAAPVMAACALAIRLADGPPVLYRQERMGLDGRRFSMLKFRTMRPDAEAASGPRWAEKQDPRTFPVGRFLRRFSLDELPQFWNVLRGDMSIVGPRPERPALIEDFKRKIPRYMFRHAVKAGITGWAQVNGWRGNTSLKKRIQYDLYYIENWSLLFDLKIMALTLVRGFWHPNAY